MNKLIRYLTLTAALSIIALSSSTSALSESDSMNCEGFGGEPSTHLCPSGFSCELVEDEFRCQEDSGLEQKVTYQASKPLIEQDPNLGGLTGENIVAGIRYRHERYGDISGLPDNYCARFARQAIGLVFTGEKESDNTNYLLDQIIGPKMNAWDLFAWVMDNRREDLAKTNTRGITEEEIIKHAQPGDFLFASTTETAERWSREACHSNVRSNDNGLIKCTYNKFGTVIRNYLLATHVMIYMGEDPENLGRILVAEQAGDKLRIDQHLREGIQLVGIYGLNLENLQTEPTYSSSQKRHPSFGQGGL
jgi:hypothetical protein